MDKRSTLKKNGDFRRLYSKGSSAVTPYMVVYCRRSPGKVNRLGYTVSTKLGGAVTRNRVRRRFRELYRLNVHRLKQGFDIVIVARSRCVGAEFAQLERAFLKACAKLGLCAEETE